MLAFSPQKQLVVAVILALSLVVLSVLLQQSRVLLRWDNLIYDLESATIVKPVDDNIVIVAIDDASLQKLGRWPWPRAIHARLLDKLTTAGVSVVGMDLLFMEADLESPQDDRRLAAAMRRNGRVVLPVLTTGSQLDVSMIKPIAPIAQAAVELAHVNLLFDAQGIVRQLKPSIRLVGGQRLPAMALALSRQSHGHNLSSLENLPGDGLLIPFAGPPGHFRQLSYAHVLMDNKLYRQLRNKVVLVGMTAAGLGRRVATPVSKTDHLMSGIEFQANALAAVLSGQLIRTVALPGYTLITFLLIVIPVVLYTFVNSRVALSLMLGFFLFTSLFSWLLLSLLQIWFAPLATLLCLVMAYPLCSWRRLEQLGHSLFSAHEKARATLQAIDDAVITTDSKGCVEFLNPAAEKMLACTEKEVKRKPFADVCQMMDQHESGLLEHYPTRIAREWDQTRLIRNRNGDEFIVRVSSTPLRSEKGIPTGFVYALNDITEIVNISREIAFIAGHDALTGLPNRVLLQDRLQQAVSVASRENKKFAVLFIDLDGFKKINDGMGHACGDQLLQDVSQRLRDQIRRSDTVSRWGGDEFVLLLRNLSVPPDAADVAAKIIKSLSRSFLLNEEEVFVTPSIGISLFPEDGENGDILLAKADAAMYSVKKNGRNNFSFYSQNLDALAKERLILEKELHHALQASEFEIYYQPQIDLNSKRLIGAEALIRWIHPTKGLVPPDRFIPLAEEIGLIVPMGEWIIKTVCHQIKSWENCGLPPIRVAINLSPRQFAQKDLVQIITREIQKHGVRSTQIQVEITESMIIRDIDRVIDILNNLKANGISIAIDDFGTGFSSLEYLKRFPIDKLKIDKSFVGNVLHNSDDASIVQAVIVLGHNLNMQIIAEGVETKEQVRFLQERDCDYGQGYYFSRPVTEREMRAVIEKFHLHQK